MLKATAQKATPLFTLLSLSRCMLRPAALRVDAHGGGDIASANRTRNQLCAGGAFLAQTHVTAWQQYHILLVYLTQYA